MFEEVAAPGLASGFVAAPGATHYHAIGPFARGAWLVSVEFHVVLDALGQYGISASLGGSSAASAAGLQAGVSLFRGNASTTDGVPGAAGFMGAAGMDVFTVYPGVRVARSSAYLIVAMTTVVATWGSCVTAVRMVERRAERAALPREEG